MRDGVVTKRHEPLHERLQGYKNQLITLAIARLHRQHVSTFREVLESDPQCHAPLAQA